jgi:hypothetical protein
LPSVQVLNGVVKPDFSPSSVARRRKTLVFHRKSLFTNARFTKTAVV